MGCMTFLREAVSVATIIYPFFVGSSPCQFILFCKLWFELVCRQKFHLGSVLCTGHAGIVCKWKKLCRAWERIKAGKRVQWGKEEKYTLNQGMLY